MIVMKSVLKVCGCEVSVVENDLLCCMCLIMLVSVVVMVGGLFCDCRVCRVFSSGMLVCSNMVSCCVNWWCGKWLLWFCGVSVCIGLMFSR